ncbi:hypothetical protein HY993_00390 [Candidatus Micrarchaeota archaeon]|nr:hypothetical protein [Candidatus Micrarchaeota archaeon]
MNKAANFAQIKSFIASKKPAAPEHPEWGQGNPAMYSPTYLPVEVDPKNPVTMAVVQTRKAFLDNYLGRWKEIRAAKGMAYTLAAITLFLLPFSIYAAIGTAYAAGAIYSGHQRNNWYFHQVMSKRPVMYTG